MPDREPTGAVVREVRGFRIHRFPDGVDYLSVSTVLKVCRFGEIDPGIPAHILEAARDRGAAVGHMIALHAQGKLDVEALFHREEYAPLRPFWDQWASFLRETPFTPTSAEVLLRHEELRVFGYADVIGGVPDDNMPWVVEIKTGRKVYDSARLQAAAYGIMSQDEPILLQLDGKGAYAVHTISNEDRDDFLAAVQVAHRYLGTRG